MFFFTFVESGEYKTDATASWRCMYIPLLTLKMFTYSLLHFRTNFPLVVLLSILHLLLGEGGRGMRAAFGNQLIHNIYQSHDAFNT